MSKWKPDLQMKRALGSGPRMFALIAIPLIERFGDEAKRIIYKAMYEDAFRRGSQLAAEAKNRDDLLEFEGLLVQKHTEQGLKTPGFDDPARKWVVKSPKKCVTNLSLCGGCEIGIPEIWKEMGLDDKTIKMLGEIHCEPRDLGMRKGFNPKVEFKFTKLVTRGDPYCEFYEEIPE